MCENILKLHAFHEICYFLVLKIYLTNNYGFGILEYSLLLSLYLFSPKSPHHLNKYLHQIDSSKSGNQFSPISITKQPLFIGTFHGDTAKWKSCLFDNKALNIYEDFTSNSQAIYKRFLYKIEFLIYAFVAFYVEWIGNIPYAREPLF